MGDRITKIDGVSTERLYQLSKLSRAEIGENQKLTCSVRGVSLPRRSRQPRCRPVIGFSFEPRISWDC